MSGKSAYRAVQNIYTFWQAPLNTIFSSSFATNRKYDESKIMNPQTTQTAQDQKKKESGYVLEQTSKPYANQSLNKLSSGEKKIKLP